ncbi:MAG: hypothetical protein ABR520_01395, partial [Mycobacteriales bacterium]|nr:hypothetical protein [Frankia sp.]
RIITLDQIAIQALDYDAGGTNLLYWNGGASVTGPIWAWDGNPRREAQQLAQGPQFPSWS